MDSLSIHLSVSALPKLSDSTNYQGDKTKIKERLTLNSFLSFLLWVGRNELGLACFHSFSCKAHFIYWICDEIPPYPIFRSIMTFPY